MDNGVSVRTKSLMLAPLRVLQYGCTALVAVALACNTPSGGDGSPSPTASPSGSPSPTSSPTPGDVSSFQVRLTGVSTSSSGEAKGGDDLIAIGTGVDSGVQYIIPSQDDTTARNISNLDTYEPAAFGVTGHWILVRTLEGIVTAFNAETEERITYPEEDLAIIAGAARTQFVEFATDGDYVAILNDMNRVADGLALKVLDLSTTPPTLSGYANPQIELTEFRENEFWQVAIDASANRVVVQATDYFVVYTLDDPAAAPQAWDLRAAGGISNTESIHLDGDYVIYQAQETAGNGRPVTRILNIVTGEGFQPDANPSYDVPRALSGGVFGYFAYETDADISTNQIARSVLGVIGEAGPELTVTNEDRTPIGADPEDGIIGYGCSIDITPNGEYAFIAGCGSPLVAEYLQVSTGGAYQVIPDQHDLDFDGLGTPASDVYVSESLAVFRTPAGVAYIVLP